MNICAKYENLEYRNNLETILYGRKKLIANFKNNILFCDK